MPTTPPQLADDLRGFVRGRVIADELARGLYATDASPFHILPAAVVVPLDEDDLIAVVKYAHEHAVPITPRGAGTGLAGESLGAGIVLDLSANFRAISDITGDTVTVEPGVTLAELNAELAVHSRRFAPDPASGGSCTLGGMIATNASGGSAFRHGYTRDHLAGVRAVRDDGLFLETSTTDERLTAVATLLAENRELIRAHQPLAPFNRCGYLLPGVLTRGGVDLAKLLAGSEGTLAVVTRATLRTIPLAGGVCQFALGFTTLEAALRAGPELRAATGIVACDVLDQRLLSLAKIALVPAAAGAVILGKIEADTEREAVEFGQQAVERVRAAHHCLVIVEPTGEPQVLDRLRAFRDSAVSSLYALGRGRRPEAFIEDIGVPPEVLPEFVARVQEILRADELNASFLVHLLTGQIHTRPLLDVTLPADREKMWPLADKVHTLALELRGTISTQHGVGLARTPWVEKQYGPLTAVFREIKRTFDPKNILNPGKILGPDPSRPAWPMASHGVKGTQPGVWQTPASGSTSDGSGSFSAVSQTPDSDVSPAPFPTPVERQPLLLWRDNSPQDEANKCNGCGDCRPRRGPVRMCPIFRATGDEAATPRAKANVVRLLDDPAKLEGDEVEAVARLCVNCKMCRDECRAKVDVPKLMLEAKAAYHEAHGFRRHDWLLARAESLMRLASRSSWTVNVLLASRGSRWLLEKFFGLSRHRKLPRFTHRTFLRQAWWAGLTKRPKATEARKVAYFVDVFANVCDPGIGHAAVAVLKHHGFEVHVPFRQRGSGMTPLSFGDADAARDAARYNLRALVELARDGYTIVCTEPAAALALSHDYLSLLDDADAALVANQTVELTTFLGELHERGELKSPTRPLLIGIGHHVPCHVKATGKLPASPKLLSLIEGITVDAIDRGCSGMAGAWGLGARNFEASLKAGAEMIAALDRPRILYGSTECSACRMQMQQASGKRTLHPVQYLAMAYGLIEMDLE
ncbi:FAD-binding oxidoreductase [Limnoglobus roseus]|uniref:FAD-binding oxidoreductase n=1 Tax=Limnoglobus roseus TaxID=2598579 RepID=A0A5C1A8F7_9BACT|nr:FAD-binding oxidoreductase [Limnoglobus roseus]QEL14473.1 FAD-binding oxidoreductase [Limnoglobus roseus]